ncbi:MAG: hypothetical protein HOL01_18360 [Planctomycetaceae bacterium]|jgi:hypothetical protein|nr:hypothetical protein [Planctomycetaceae bacterium]
MNRPPEYWTAVAKGIEAEDDKARIYASSHPPSLGVAREGIIRAEMRRETPHPFEVTTGMVCLQSDHSRYSKQLDVLVYNPEVARPFYDVEGFSIVSELAASCAVEVKSNLYGSEFEDAISVSQSVEALCDKMTNRFPCLTFGFDGMTFATFIKKLEIIARDDFWHAPAIIAVHSQNYFAARETMPRDGMLPAYAAIDFGRAKAKAGLATASFLYWYSQVVGNKSGWRGIHCDDVYHWMSQGFIDYRRLEVGIGGGVVEYSPGEARDLRTWHEE